MLGPFMDPDDPQYAWRRWFAWFPVPVDADKKTGKVKRRAFFKVIERRRQATWTWEWFEYREIGSQTSGRRLTYCALP